MPFLIAIAVSAALLAAAPAGAQSAAGAVALPGMGDYSHPIQTTSAEAQKFFDQGLALLYNFNHAEAERSFLKAAELDPRAPMPWWGVGVALGLNYNRDVTKLEGERMLRAYDAAQKAVTLSRGGNAIEAALADALATRYSRDPDHDPEALNAKYREAMRQVYATYPDDPEVATMYADAVMNLRPWQLWKADGSPETDTPELVKVLEGILRRHPDHPGANHYYIHAVEASPTPDRALASATRLETLVPGAGHLVHMPTHIYIHTGHIDRVAELNARAAKADERYIEIAKPEGVYHMYYGHNVHFVVVGSLQTGRYDDAMKASAQMATIVEPHLAHIGPQMEWAAGLGLLTDVRFHKWDRILTAARPGADRPLTRAFDHYARALAFRYTGKAAEATQEAAQFDVARRSLPEETLIGMFNPASVVLEMASHLLAGQLASNTDEAVAHLEKAAAAQDAFRYDEPEPWPWSVRETLGAVLLSAGRHGQAEKVFRLDLEKNPGSGRALFGLLTSLDGQQKSAEAALIRREFDRAWAKSTEPLSVERLF